MGAEVLMQEQLSRVCFFDAQFTCSGSASGRSCALGLSEGRLQVSSPSDFLSFFIR